MRRAGLTLLPLFAVVAFAAAPGAEGPTTPAIQAQAPRLVIFETFNRPG